MNKEHKEIKVCMKTIVKLKGQSIFFFFSKYDRILRSTFFALNEMKMKKINTINNKLFLLELNLKSS